MTLKAIHSQECREAALQKARAVTQRLKELKLSRAFKIVEDGIEETLTYMFFPSQH